MSQRYDTIPEPAVVLNAEDIYFLDNRGNTIEPLPGMEGVKFLLTQLIYQVSRVADILESTDS